MPNWHDDNWHDDDCAECLAHEDRFWREQGEGADEHIHLGFDGSFDPLDAEDDEPPVGERDAVPEDDVSW